MTVLIVATTVAGSAFALTMARASEAGTSPRIDWNGACPTDSDPTKPDPKQTCGTIRVPLDYAKPEGKTIEVTVSRIATAKAASRRGVLLINPGGPGQSGLNQPTRFMTKFPNGVLDQYDLIGFDPRGIGRSTPLTCGIDLNEVNKTIGLADGMPDGNGSIARNTAYAKTVADGCRAKSGDALKYFTTANTARDMDQIRIALKESRISYFGTSYGTYLGAAYATLFESKTDRVVLDSAIDPSAVWYNQWSSSSRAAAVPMRHTAQYIAKNNDTYGLGNTDTVILDNLNKALASLDKEPYVDPANSNNSVDGNKARSFLLQYLMDGSEKSIDDAAGVLNELNRIMSERSNPTNRASGHRPLRALGATVQVPADNVPAMRSIIQCNDAKWPRDEQTYATNVSAVRAEVLLSGGMHANITPCAFWPNDPIEPKITVTGQGGRNILILQNTRDFNTPVAGARALRKDLGQRSILIEVKSNGHSVYRKRSDAADDRVDAFLDTGRLPSGDLICKSKQKSEQDAEDAQKEDCWGSTRS